MIYEQQAGGVFVHLESAQCMAAAFVKQSGDLRVSYQWGDLLWKLLFEICVLEKRQKEKCPVVFGKFNIGYLPWPWRNQSVK